MKNRRFVDKWNFYEFEMPEKFDYVSYDYPGVLEYLFVLEEVYSWKITE